MIVRGGPQVAVGMSDIKRRRLGLELKCHEGDKVGEYVPFFFCLQFKRVYPENFKAYVAACERGEVEPGRMFVFDTGQLAPRWIINFPTKQHWRAKSRIEYIERGMEALVEEIRARRIRSIAIPPLGSGLGGLVWSEVKPVIQRSLETVPEVTAVVFEPGGGPAADWKGLKAAKRPRMTAGRAALVGLVGRFLSAMMDTSVTLLEVHKLMYFLQAAVDRP
jgi:hypothetical protein